jgi:hypothetical protein
MHIIMKTRPGVGPRSTGETGRDVELAGRTEAGGS